MSIRMILPVEDGGEEEVSLPSRWFICGTCQGNGSHSIHVGVITRDEMEQEWEGEEFAEYLRGAYDQTCGDCNGEGKVQVIDWPRVPRELAVRVRDVQRDLAETYAMQRAEYERGA